MDELGHERRETQESLKSQLDEFEQNNPKVAEAMRLLGMSLATYQGALFAMQGVRLTQSSSTTVEVLSPQIRG